MKKKPGVNMSAKTKGKTKIGCRMAIRPNKLKQKVKKMIASIT
jgi:hypothetical protein